MRLYSVENWSLLAWWKGRRTGRGQHLDVSVMESVANLSDWAIPNYSANPATPARAGSGIYTLYRCADGWVRMIVLVTHHWHALLEWAGLHPRLEDAEIATDGDELDRFLFARRPA